MDKRKGKWSKERKQKWLGRRHPVANIPKEEVASEKSNNSEPNSNNFE